MQPWFLSELDFIYAMYGAAFFVLGGVCFMLAGHSRSSSLKWGWLIAFACLHGLNEWADYSFILLGNVVWLAALRYGLLLSSFLALMEFGRENTCLRERISPLKFYAAVLGALSLSFMAGPANYHALTRYMVGFPGGILAGWALLSASGKERRSYSLLTLGISMLAYAVLAGTIVPYDGFFPASFLNENLFLSLFSVPVQVVRAVLAFGMAFFAWCYLREVSFSVGGRAGTVSSSRPDLIRYVVFAVCMAIICGGWYLTDKLGHRQDMELRSNIMSLTYALGSSLEMPHFLQLKGRPSDKDLPVTRHLLNHMQRVVNEQKYIATFYLMGERD